MIATSRPLYSGSRASGHRKCRQIAPAHRAFEPTMKLTRRQLTALFAAKLALSAAMPATAFASEGWRWGIRETRYADVIAEVAKMPWDGDLQSRASRHGLNVVNVMWEDTGRYQGSSVGPNISDLTLQVREQTD